MVILLGKMVKLVAYKLKCGVVVYNRGPANGENQPILEMNEAVADESFRVT